MSIKKKKMMMMTTNVLVRHSSSNVHHLGRPIKVRTKATLDWATIKKNGGQFFSNKGIMIDISYSMKYNLGNQIPSR